MAVKDTKLQALHEVLAEVIATQVAATDSYMDEAGWGIPGAFDVLTDGILISDSGSTAGKSGMLTFPVEMTDTYLDATSYFQSGLGKWLEGRLYIQHSGTASQMVGFVGVRYV